MNFGKSQLVASLLLTFSAVNAHSSGLALTDNGLGVYDSALNATWTQDANLLGTLENTYGYDTIVNAIIAAVPFIHDTPNYLDGTFYNNDGTNNRAYSGTYALSARDFGIGGTVDWFAAQAYVSYLNSLNNGAGYGGSNQWALPTQPDQNSGFNIKNSQLGELFYNELGGTALRSIPSGPFSNVQAYAYWSGTELEGLSNFAWLFETNIGFQGNLFKDGQIDTSTQPLYAWAISPGQLTAVPLPNNIWLFGSAIASLIGFNRKKTTKDSSLFPIK